VKAGFLMTVSHKQMRLQYQHDKKQPIAFDVYDVVNKYEPRLKNQKLLGFCDTTVGQVSFMVAI
jgi:hypothetical protein